MPSADELPAPARVRLSRRSDPAHGRALRLAREARDRLRDGDPALPVVDFARCDALWEVPA